LGGILKKISDFFNFKLLKENGSSTILDWILSHRFILLLFFALISAFLIILVINVRNVNEILVSKRTFEKDIKILKDNNSRLHSKIIQLQSAERIIPFAEQRLNMYLPQDAPKILRKENEEN